MSEPGAFVIGAILAIPALSAAVLALLPDDRTSARLNAFASGLTFTAMPFWTMMPFGLDGSSVMVLETNGP